MAATISRLMTVDEFRRLPEDSGGVYHELRRGEVVAVTRPKLKHTLIQHNLRKVVEAACGGAGFAEIELAFRPVAEYELRVADVAWVSPERWAGVNVEDNLRGAPDLVIEVLSPSNTAAELYEKERLCLENGAREFWVVDPDLRQVKVSTPDGCTVTFRSGQEIPLGLFGESKIGVDVILPPQA